MQPVAVHEGTGPVVLGLPHTGTHVPGDVLARLNQTGRVLSDTDWHVDRLYAGLLAGATTVRATFHRYVIDANRDPSGESLYPGQATTGLVPETDFDGQPIWREGEGPDDADIADRLKRFHTPYHAALRGQLDRVRAQHGVAVLYDCHSIRSVIPRLFDGTLPDFNIGDFKGAACAPAVTRAVADICADQRDYSHVLNGRFKGGWTTRHYGDPAAGVHAIQMELSQATHLTTETPPFDYDPEKAERLRPILKQILSRLDYLAVTGALQ
ncbi:MAG: N-formylglutamate deformylase [Alphaproteobacteria bacterium]|nr:N-formylglutamate deformylase [Alphaproteobacteria bacterium]